MWTAPHDFRTTKIKMGRPWGLGIRPARYKLNGCLMGGTYLRPFLSSPVFFLSGCAVVSSLHLLFAYLFLYSCLCLLDKIYSHSTASPGIVATSVAPDYILNRIMEGLTALIAAYLPSLLFHYRADLPRTDWKIVVHEYICKRNIPHMIWFFWCAYRAPFPHITSLARASTICPPSDQPQGIMNLFHDRSYCNSSIAYSCCFP